MRAMQLTIPRTGEVWQADSLHYLAWEGAADAKIEYSFDAGGTWQTIPDNGADRRPPDDPQLPPSTLNRLLWKTPNRPDTTCHVRARAPDGRSDPAATTGIRIVSSGERRYRWEQITLNAAFAGRDGAGALTFHDRMWLLGGWNPMDQVHFPNDCNSEVWSSRDGLRWQLVNPSAPWEKRHTAGYVVHRDRMWIVGGDPIQTHYQPDVWNSEDGVQWNRITARAPWAERILHYTAAHAGRIWVMGGQKVTAKVKSHVTSWPDPVEPVYYNDVWSSEDGRHWDCVLEEAPWAPRGLIGGSAVKDGYIWLLSGGCYYERYYPEVWRSPDGVRWELVSALTPWYPRCYHDVAVYDGRLWIMEGCGGPGFNRADVWYSSDGNNWYEASGVPWAPRHAASVFVYDDALWMVAGNNMQPDVWKLQPAT